jgi:hypothetical protein
MVYLRFALVAEKCNLCCDLPVVPVARGKQGMGGHMPFSEFFAFLSVVMISVFSFVSIAVWVEGRRKEREAYYKAESLRRISEMPAESASQVIAMLQEEERLRYNHELDNEWKKLAGSSWAG